MLEKVKAALGITGTYQDDTINAYIDEVKQFLIDGGVDESVVEADTSSGIIARGVADLWNYGSGEAHLSQYFLQRAAQLSYTGNKTIEYSTVKKVRNDEVKQEYMRDVDLSAYALKSDIPSLNGYALKDDVPNTDVFATKEELNAYAKAADIPSLDGYALKSEMPDDYFTNSDFKRYAINQSKKFVNLEDADKQLQKNIDKLSEKINNGNTGSSDSSTIRYVLTTGMNAGNISGTIEDDALNINLDGLGEMSSWNVSQDGEEKKTISDDDTLDFVSTDTIIANVSDDGEVSFDLNEDKLNELIQAKLDELMG